MTNIENAQTAPASNQNAKPNNNQKAKAGKVLPDQSKQPKVANLRMPIPEGESAKRDFKTDADAKKVVSTFSFKLSDKATERYQVVSQFDFSTCSMEEILELAAATVRIVVQSKLRAMGEGARNPNVYTNVNVKAEVVDTQRQAVDDFTKASRALGKLSDAERQQILAALSAK
jgi:hypothetical protein